MTPTHTPHPVSGAGQVPLVEASIQSLLDALAAGEVTSEQLVMRSLERIDAYDLQGPILNAVPVLNDRALEDARASDERRARGEVPRPLEGIPFTVKDSYLAEGLTAAAGSPAFKKIVATSDAFTVKLLKQAGAILIGKTNMPPMADGGMQRGLYGRAESPYNSEYLAAAYASGSSNGSGVAVATSMCVFGMGEETVSSGRSPASNNSLCAYTPSWGVLSIRGNWPLFPARDVVVPHTRTMRDMLRVLDVIVQDDPETRGDFWRHQNVVDIPRASEHRPDSYLDLDDPDALRGVRLAIPRMYLGEDPAFPINVHPEVLRLFDVARERLESLGATLVETNFPLIEEYEGDKPGSESVDRLGVLPDGWMDTEFAHILPFGWDDFLRANTGMMLADVNADDIFPRPHGSLPDRYEEVEDYDNRYRMSVEFAKQGIPDPREREDFGDGIHGILKLREMLFTSWLQQEGFDGVVFPANADVGRANADVDAQAADHAWQNGVFFSNGNYAVRHVGLPTVTVPMGIMQDTRMPVGLTLMGDAHDDLRVLSWAAAFEHPGSLRVPPQEMPELP